MSFLIGVVMAQGLETIVGGSGWVGAGLLGLVLGWLLLVHLPGKDKQIERLIADKDKMILDLMARHEKVQEELRSMYQASLDKVVTHCANEIGSIERIADKVLQASGGPQWPSRS